METVFLVKNLLKYKIINFFDLKKDFAVFFKLKYSEINHIYSNIVFKLLIHK